MEARRLGANGPAISAIGLGCMGMSGLYGPADDKESVATIGAALDARITLLDTGDFYGMGHNERLVGEAIRGRRERAFLSVKFGAQRDPSGAFIGFDGRPASVKNFLAYSLRRLGTDYVDLYQPARVDPEVPIEDTVGAIADLIRAGHVRHLGLSEASAATLRQAHAVHPVAALQIEYSLLTRDIEAEILPTARELGIGIVAYGVIGRGLLSGAVASAADIKGGDVRAHQPRFARENLARNLALVEALGAIARDKGVSPAQLAVAWVMAQGADIVPLVGMRRRDRLPEALAAATLALSPKEIATLAQAVPADAVAGARYAPAQMRMLNG
jgi:aryl-alcohol dehydrogenase-like predicted oxidoreductase